MNAMETEDLAYVAYMDEQAGAQEAAERRSYETWAEARREDGLPSSEEDYGDYLEALAGV
jgi:hypothetical protein